LILWLKTALTADSGLAAMSSIYPRNYLPASAVPNNSELNFLKYPRPPASKATIPRRAVDMSTLTAIVQRHRRY